MFRLYTLTVWGLTKWVCIDVQSHFQFYKIIPIQVPMTILLCEEWHGCLHCRWSNTNVHKDGVAVTEIHVGLLVSLAILVCIRKPCSIYCATTMGGILHVYVIFNIHDCVNSSMLHTCHVDKDVKPPPHMQHT